MFLWMVDMGREKKSVQNSM